MIDQVVQTLTGWRSKYKTDFGFFPQRSAPPTSTAPGSLERIRVLADRVQRGQPTFVSGDLIDGRSAYCDQVLEAWETENREWKEHDDFQAE